jgi:hypothetical protein
MKNLLLYLLAILIIISIEYFTTWVVMILWNYVMPYLFNLPEINFWKALALNILISILFRGFKSKNS